jgi:hypothetical protein
VTRRQERRRKQLLIDVQERKDYRNFKEKAIDRKQWRTHFGRGYIYIYICHKTNCVMNELMV